MHTYRSALELVGTSVPDHLVADAEVPVLVGPQAQGDLLVFRKEASSGLAWQPVPINGLQLMHGEATGNTHWLHPGFQSPGIQFARSSADGVRLGFLLVPPGQTALLIHTDEHGANGIGPGTYVIHRKRERIQLPASGELDPATEIRLVAD
jgi:hypothetical protein